ncbi:MAG: outer membrane protein assembly factor BamA [Nitrospira sp.]|nr:outer membrane protein assembly factor BamA [Nitrospira sp.]MDD9859116.1 outer membrane protein assembly factor BamA [Nitrospira sp.]
MSIRTGRRPAAISTGNAVRKFTGHLVTMVWCGFLALSLPSLGVSQPQDVVVESVTVQGNERIESTAILGKTTLKAGGRVTQEVLREQIRLIYDMGFFDDVRVETETIAEGVDVIFVVKEKPFVVEIAFDGNDKVSDDELQEVITLENQVFLDQQEIKVSAEKIREQYQKEGYHKVKIIPIVQALGESRNRVVFFVQEGTRARVESIRFVGLTLFDRDDLLGVMANREWSPFFSLFTDAGILHREELDNDVERIKEFYANKGYLDVQIGPPSLDLSDDKEAVTLTFRIIEGHPYTVRTVRYEGTTVFEDEELEQDSFIRPNDVFQRAMIRDEVARVTDLYGEKGYSFAEVTPTLDPNSDTLTTDVTFTVKEGSLIRVREIHIVGNDRTRDNVIRRELRVNEQEVIDSVAMARSFQRLNNLNFFETVEIVPTQVEEDKVDLDVTVREKPTGQFSIGGGFSTLDRFTAIANISEGNLFGLGYLVRIRGQIGGRRTIGVMTFRNPALFDSATSFQINGFSTDTNFLTYAEERQGVTFEFGQAISEYMTGNLTLVAESILIKNPASGAGSYVTNQVGTQSTTGFRANIFRDTRDYFQDPRLGSRTGANVGFGTDLLGGTNNFYKIDLDGLKYVPLPFWDLRVALRSRFGLGQGYKGDALPLSELFFVGGINTVRGFRFGRAGPVTPSGTLRGATKQLIFNADLVFPVLPGAKLNGVVFFDYGKGFADDEDLDFDLRPATGFEVRWISPFGPLRAALGINLSKRPQEQGTVFEFSVGNVF